MAKFNEYTEKTTPDDNDITLILDSTANANKKTPFSGNGPEIPRKRAGCHKCYPDPSERNNSRCRSISIP